MSLIEAGERMKKVYITSNIPDVADEILSEHFIVEKNIKNEFLSQEQLIEIGNEYDGLITSLTNKFDAETLSKIKEVEIFANYAVGYNNFDMEYAKQHNLVITNTPDVLSDTTAEMALALLFAVSRRVIEANQYLLKGHWEGFKPQLLLGQDIFNKTIGIIGAGRIGHRFAEKIRGFHMQVVYHNRKRDLAFEKSFNAKYLTLEDLMKVSDIVSIHVPLTEETYHMIGPKELDSMKENAILINTSRGPVIDEDALIKVLENHRIYGAGLDVFENEPNVNPKLLALNNVVLTPHIGSASVETREKMAVMAARNVKNVLLGDAPINLVEGL